MKYLKTCCKNVILIVFVSGIAAPNFWANRGQEKAKGPDSSVKGLRLSAELVGDELFNPKETIRVKLKLENTSKSPVYLHKQLGIGAGGFRITILDTNNSWVPPNFVRETFPTPVYSKEDLQAIEPGKHVEQQIDILLDHYTIAPGDYTLKIAYVSPVAPEEATKGLTVLLSEDGTLEAKPIPFVVLDLGGKEQASDTAEKPFKVSASAEFTNRALLVQRQAPCPNALTQREIDRCATEQFRRADHELNQVYKRILSRLYSGDRSNLIQTQRAWLKYRDSNCKAERQFHGGSLALTIEAFCLRDITDARTKELVRIYQTEER